MVILKEVGSNNMFWGVSLDGGKRYTQVVETAFHVSMAALEPTTEELPKGKRAVSLWIQQDKAEFVLCTLEHHRTMQQALDLNFTEGEEITLFTTGGNSAIHLSGYLMDQSDDDADNTMPEMSEEDMMSSDEDSDSDDAVPQLLPIGDSKSSKKRKKAQGDTKKKKQKVTVIDNANFDSDDDDEDEDFTIGDEDEMYGDSNDDSEDDDDDDSEDDDSDDSDSEDDDSEDDDSDDDDDSEEEDEEEEKVMNVKHTPKNLKTGQQTPNKLAENKSPKNKTPKVNGTPVETQSSKKKKKKMKEEMNKNAINTPKSEMNIKLEETPSKTPNKKQVLADGLVIEDIKVGNGPPAKPDKMAHMYYVGKLSSGKQFDSCTGGKPFKFRLGKQEVIKGWDLGVKGMKVGGKRRLIVPPKLGYGNHKQGPIPANSTLVFDVELKAVS